MSFLVKDRPIVVGMIKSTRPDDIIAEAERLRLQGAEALGLQLETVSKENKTPPVLKRIIKSLPQVPLYVTDYRRCNVTAPTPTDDELASEMLSTLAYGARLIDVRGDMFHPEDGEFTEAPEAVKAQKDLILQIKALGGEVLMSTHVFHHLDTEEVLRIATAMYERGADIAKIVSVADTEDELKSAFATTEELKRRLPIPSLFLVNGTMCKRHRTEAPLIENSMFLAVEEARANPIQPTVKMALQMIKTKAQGDA